MIRAARYARASQQASQHARCLGPSYQGQSPALPAGGGGQHLGPQRTMVYCFLLAHDRGFLSPDAYFRTHRVSGKQAM